MYIVCVRNAKCWLNVCMRCAVLVIRNTVMCRRHHTYSMLSGTLQILKMYTLDMSLNVDEYVACNEEAETAFGRVAAVWLCVWTIFSRYYFKFFSPFFGAYNNNNETRHRIHIIFIAFFFRSSETVRAVPLFKHNFFFACCLSLFSNIFHI